MSVGIKKEKMKITLDQLTTLLQDQKRIVIKKLLSETYTFNSESTEGHVKSIQNINNEKFEQVGMSAGYPNDIEVLKRYLD